jgi:L-threonylcarbamoyladenylate synthase
MHRIWRIAPGSVHLHQQEIAQAASLLKNNQVVAFPTETVYGLGGNALSDEAITNVFKAKGRPSDNPLIVHIASVDQLKDLVLEVPDIAKKLMDRFWPGPLTILLRKKPGVISDKATANLSVVGIRIPDHPVALELLKQANIPVAAPSANISGRPSPTKADHVIEDLGDKVAGIIDAGPTGIGVESTVVDCVGKIDQGIVTICRPGGVTKLDLEQVLGEGNVLLDPAVICDVEKKNSKEEEKELKPIAPGMKYRHYSPKAPLFVIDGDSSFFKEMVDKYSSENSGIGALVTRELYEKLQEHLKSKCTHVQIAGAKSDQSEIARNLYDHLRAFDNFPSVKIILAESFVYGTSQTGDIGQAVMNRLLKASEKVISGDK